MIPIRTYFFVFLLFIQAISYSQRYSCLDYYYNNSATHGIKIFTNLPFQNSNQMPTIHFEGFAFGRANTVDIKLSWYIYGDNFYNANASSAGGWAPKIFLANENGKVVIFISDQGYFSRLQVSAYAYGLGESSSWFAGWYTSDQPVGGNNIVEVPYKNHLPGNTIIGRSSTQAATLLHMLGEHGTTQFRMTLPASSNYNGSGDINLQTWVSEPGVTWDAGGIGMNVNNDNGTPAQFGRLNQQIGQSYIRFIPNGGGMEFSTTDNSGISYKSSMYLQGGKLGIGTSNPGTYKLAVEGTIGARKIKVTQLSWADDVFTPEYPLISIKGLKNFIKKNGHLPQVPKASDIIGTDIDITETQTLLLKKIEELTLYVIELKEENESIKKRIKKLEKIK